MARLALLALAGVLGGCALIEYPEIAATERELAKAGFHTRAPSPADSDLPPGEMVERWDGEKTVYLYADPDVCRCVYTGATPQYALYRWLDDTP